MAAKTHKITFSALFIFLLFSLLLTAFAEPNQSPNKTDSNLPERLKRADSFIGIHFDFHAGENDNRIGENVTPQMVQTIIDKVKPDYIQVDTKGHAGYSSYPTKVGNQAPGFVRDPLRIWRDVTARNGVALYAHHSGVYDRNAISLHPDWACVNADGKINKDDTSVFGDYADKLLIPQLKELALDYKLDGAWIDGECWAVKPDYSPKALAALKAATGIFDPPRSTSDPNYPKFAEFNRQSFRNYVRHYVDEVHKSAPSFQITSNWAYSTKMPEPVDINLDFLSGDYLPMNSVNSARYEGRFFRSQGKPWDLMAWSFSYFFPGENRGITSSTKPAIQLKQEAAVVLALGGGFQAYYRQKDDASIYDWQMDIMAEVAKFCRARQKFCHKVTPVKEIALLLSKDALYKDGDPLFSQGDDKILSLRGTLTALLDAQLPADIVAEHHLTPNTIRQWRLIIVPEWEYLAKDFKDLLIQYVKEGGNLLIIGTDTARMFKDHLGVTFIGNPETENRWLCHNNFLAGEKTTYQVFRPDANTSTFGTIYIDNDTKGPSRPAASIKNYDNGKIAAVYFDFGKPYLRERTTVARDFLADLVRKLYQPIVDVEGSHNVDVTVNKLGENLAISLINTTGPLDNKNICTFDEIPVVGPLKISIRSLKSRPLRIHLEPEGKNIEYSWNDGTATLTIPKLEIYDIIILEQ